jgi:AraC-like DNA-binding protein
MVKRKKAVTLTSTRFSKAGLRARPKDARTQFGVDWLLRQDLRRDLRVEEIARLVHLSASRLRHLFKNETGVPLTVAVKSLRLEAAKDMLENSFLKVKEVMAAVGCTDMSHFARDYKAMWGETPSRPVRVSSCPRQNRSRCWSAQPAAMRHVKELTPTGVYPATCITCTRAPLTVLWGVFFLQRTALRTRRLGRKEIINFRDFMDAPNHSRTQ